MRFRTKLLLRSERFQRLSRVMAYTFISLIAVSHVSAAENRFTAPELNAPLDDFTKRVESSIFNSDFLVAHLLNNARQIQRDGKDLANNLAVFADQINSGAISNSVIVPPGTKADTIIVINQNDGDSFAIQR